MKSPGIHLCLLAYHFITLNTVYRDLPGSDLKHFLAGVKTLTCCVKQPGSWGEDTDHGNQFALLILKILSIKNECSESGCIPR